MSKNRLDYVSIIKRKAHIDDIERIVRDESWSVRWKRRNPRADDSVLFYGPIGSYFGAWPGFTALFICVFRIEIGLRAGYLRLLLHQLSVICH